MVIEKSVRMTQVQRYVVCTHTASETEEQVDHDMDRIELVLILFEQPLSPPYTAKNQTTITAEHNLPYYLF